MNAFNIAIHVNRVGMSWFAGAIEWSGETNYRSLSGINCEQICDTDIVLVYHADCVIGTERLILSSNGFKAIIDVCTIPGEVSYHVVDSSRIPSIDMYREMSRRHVYTRD